MKCTNPKCGVSRATLHTCAICKRKLCGCCISWTMDDGKRHCLIPGNNDCAVAHRAQVKTSKEIQ